MEQNDITLTISQQRILKQIQDFIYRSDDRVFVLKGYAGTGKTTMMKFLIDDLRNHGQQFKLLSTTGRAAKVLANHTCHEAVTIHSLIYKYKDFNKDLSEIDVADAKVDTTGQLFLVFEPARLTDDDRKRMVYIVDEASMISDTEVRVAVQAMFGSGRLLKELLDFDTLPESKFIFVGDPCQLPPINDVASPALSPRYFADVFGLSAQEGQLTEIMRQDNSIITAGTYIRKLWARSPDNESVYPSRMWGAALQFSAFEDIVIHNDLFEMEKDYMEAIRRNGYNDSIFICNSNARCMEMSEKIRRALGFEGCIKQGDLLMVVQNQFTTGLMNGDMVEVVEVGAESEKIMRSVKDPQGVASELAFRKVKVKELFTGNEYTTLLLETILTGRQNNLDARQQSGLFLDFIMRMKHNGITQKSHKQEFDMAMQHDPYLNALRCNYGYAVTCHKAQGGEWNSVYIQMPRNITLNPTKNKYQWLYTALTRAKHTVHVCKDFFII